VARTAVALSLKTGGIRAGTLEITVEENLGPQKSDSGSKHWRLKVPAAALGAKFARPLALVVELRISASSRKFKVRRVGHNFGATKFQRSAYRIGSRRQSVRGAAEVGERSSHINGAATVNRELARVRE